MSLLPKFSFLSRRQILTGFLTSVASQALAGAPVRSIRPAPRTHKAKLAAAGSLEDILAKANLSGKIGFVVADARTGQLLESHKPLLTMPPASVTKTITTLYGLGALGGAYRFKTRVIATGNVVDGRLEGDLYLVGGGDPTLDTDALGILAKRLKASGVREISGHAFVYGGALPYQKSIDPDQPEYLGYNPSLSGLNLNYNRVFFEWQRTSKGYKVTMDARGVKFRPRVAMSTIRVVDRRSPIFALKTTAREDQWTVAKHALGKKGGRWLPVRRPHLYAAEVFRTLARAHGIVLPPFKTAKSVPAGTALAEWQSAALQPMLRRMLKYSTNLIAEAVGVTASHERGGKPSSLRASGRMMGDWLTRKAGARHARFVDHSGLEDGSHISAGEMVKFLQTSGWNGTLHDLLKPVAMRDAKGKKVKNGALRVKAKTGTLNFVSALAGFIETPGKNKLVFAIFTADLPKRSTIRKSQRERPKGARAWNTRSKSLQRQLIERWADTFDA